MQPVRGLRETQMNRSQPNRNNGQNMSLIPEEEGLNLIGCVANCGQDSLGSNASEINITVQKIIQKYINVMIYSSDSSLVL